jgi:hypothetical protein
MAWQRGYGRHQREIRLQGGASIIRPIGIPPLVQGELVD